jgi:hypothetical protein
MSTNESTLDYQHLAWDAIPVERIGDGIERRMIWGERR